MRVLLGLCSLCFFVLGCGPAGTDSQLNETKTLMFEGPVPEGGWRNPYYSDDDEIAAARTRGLKHSLHYPILDHAAVMPFNVANGAMQTLAKIPALSYVLKKTGIAKFGTSWTEMFDHLGLEPYPAESPVDGPYHIPEMSEETRKYAMGVTIDTNSRGVKVFTYSCAACHVRNLFGKPVIGLHSLKSRAYEYVNYAKTLASVVPKFLVKMHAGMSPAEKSELLRTKEALRWVSSPSPKAPGLDTSIAAVSSSLDMRASDEFASREKTRKYGRNLKTIRSQGFDSKPGTWWLFRYKNRFLSDGSVQGNPIVTNILWNEIGRGGDMRGLGDWFAKNEDVIADLTTAVMETKPPSWFDFFPDSFDLNKAKKGEVHFNSLCSGCHGEYEKAWNQTDSSLTLADITKTVRVHYHADTPTLDVGTDPLRAEGIKYLALGLNHLKLSQTHGAKTTHTGGYVPQPLVGIWARWPYFHNNSAANLCEVLTPSAQRMKEFYIVDAVDKHKDYDASCVGLPYPDKLPDSKKLRKFDARKKGLSNSGHDEGIFMENGQSVLSSNEKMELIEFLKTL